MEADEEDLQSINLLLMNSPSPEPSPATQTLNRLSQDHADLHLSQLERDAIVGLLSQKMGARCSVFPESSTQATSQATAATTSQRRGPKPVAQLDATTRHVLAVFPNMTQAAKAVGTNRRVIKGVIDGAISDFQGYSFRLAESSDHTNKTPPKSHTKAPPKKKKKQLPVKRKVKSKPSPRDYSDRSVAVEQADAKGRTLRRFPSLTAAAGALRITRHYIQKSIRDKTPYKGFYYRHTTVELPKNPGLPKMPVEQVTAQNVVVHRFPSLSAAEQVTGIRRQLIRNVLDQNTTLHGFRWRTASSNLSQDNPFETPQAFSQSSTQQPFSQISVPVDSQFPNSMEIYSQLRDTSVARSVDPSNIDPALSPPLPLSPSQSSAFEVPQRKKPPARVSCEPVEYFRSITIHETGSIGITVNSTTTVDARIHERLRAFAGARDLQLSQRMLLISGVREQGIGERAGLRVGDFVLLADQTHVQVDYNVVKARIVRGERPVAVVLYRDDDLKFSHDSPPPNNDDQESGPTPPRDDDDDDNQGKTQQNKGSAGRGSGSSSANLFAPIDQTGTTGGVIHLSTKRKTEDVTQPKAKKAKTATKKQRQNPDQQHASKPSPVRKEELVPFCKLCAGRSEKRAHHAWCPQNPQFLESGANDVLDRIRRGVTVGCSVCSKEFQTGRRQSDKHSRKCRKLDGVAPELKQQQSPVEDDDGSVFVDESKVRRGFQKLHLIKEPKKEDAMPVTVSPVNHTNVKSAVKPLDNHDSRVTNTKAGPTSTGNGVQEAGLKSTGKLAATQKSKKTAAVTKEKSSQTQKKSKEATVGAGTTKTKGKKKDNPGTSNKTKTSTATKTKQSTSSSGRGATDRGGAMTEEGSYPSKTPPNFIEDSDISIHDKLSVSWEDVDDDIWGETLMTGSDVVVYSTSLGRCDLDVVLPSPRFAIDPFCTGAYKSTHVEPKSGFQVLQMKRDSLARRDWGLSVKRHEFGGACLVQSVKPLSPASTATILGVEFSAPLMVNDMILAVNGRKTSGMTEASLDMLFDQPLTELLLVVARYRFAAKERDRLVRSEQEGLRTLDQELNSSGLLEWKDVCGPGELRTDPSSGRLDGDPLSKRLREEEDDDNVELSDDGDEDASVTLAYENVAEDSRSEECAPLEKKVVVELETLATASSGKSIEKNDSNESVFGKQTLDQSSNKVDGNTFEKTSPDSINVSPKKPSGECTPDAKRNKTPLVNSLHSSTALTDVATLDNKEKAEFTAAKAKVELEKALDHQKAQSDSGDDSSRSDDQDGDTDDGNAWCGCICGKTHHKSVPVFWIQCEGCQTWYNTSPTCIGFSEGHAKKMKSWYCLGCDDAKDSIASDKSVKITKKKKSVRFDVGSLVYVKEHGWAGVNNPEGVAKVCKAYNDSEGDLVYDLKYIVGGSVRGVLPDYLREHFF